MGANGKTYVRLCIDCGLRVELTTASARRSRWDLWPGGGRCAPCVAKLEPATAAPLPSPFGPSYSNHIIVACSVCDREMESSQEYLDGWRPGIHWVTTAEAKQASIDSRARKLVDPRVKLVPLPLCPGWNAPGRVVSAERRELLELPPSDTKGAP